MITPGKREISIVANSDPKHLLFDFKLCVVLGFQKPPENVLKNMVPTEETSLAETEITDTTQRGLSHQIVLTDHNDNFLAVGKDDLFAVLPCDGDTKELYTSVDKQFFELMLDAVQKGLIPSELTAENWFSSDAADVALNDVVDFVDIEEPLLPTENETNKDEFPTGNASMVSCGIETEMETVEQMKATTGVSTPSETNPSMSITTVTSQNGEAEPTYTTGKNGVTVQTKEGELDVPLAEQSVPGKKVHFLGIDTVFVDTQGSPEETFRTSALCDQGLDLDPVSNSGDSKFESPPRSTVTWAALDLPSANKIRGAINNSHLKSAVQRSADIVDSVDFEESIKEDNEDPFMLYLNSIEQTALKFKLQVEQAKVDTLETLKKKLELAYEGTPLEDIPVKFREKLQETIAEIASDEVLKKYEALVGQDDEMSEEENEIVECMRNELDSVASENFQLHQQLQLLKDYEKRYVELREKFDNLNQEMTEMKNEYEKKNGESEFLAERVESLEKSIVNLRVEYNSEVRELQDENLQLQNTCFELESRNRVLEEEIQTAEQPGADGTEYLKRSDRNEHFTVNREFEILQMRLEESERQNKALRAASQADQAMIQCMEDQKERLEGALVQSEDNHSKVLMELHDAQRQMSSDRVKLSSCHEEAEALRRENKLLKSSLEIAQEEIEYLADKKGAEKSEPWKNNKKMIWKEIRELEKILKDVHREKRTLEQKYVNFRQESDQLSNSLSLQCSSPPRESPGKQHPPDQSLNSKSWHSLSTAEKDKAEANGRLSDEESFSSPPRKVKSWLDSLHSPNGLPRNDLHLDSNKNDEAPTGVNRCVFFYPK